MRIYGRATPAGPSDIHTPPPIPRVEHRPSPAPPQSSPFTPVEPGTPLRVSAQYLAATRRRGRSSGPRPHVHRDQPRLWTPERIAELRRVLTQTPDYVVAGQALGVTPNAARVAKFRYAPDILMRSQARVRRVD